MRRRRSPELVAESLAAIPDLPRAELIERWTAAYGRPPPKGLSRRLLEYAAAYHVQAQAYGGPSPAQRGKLRRVIVPNNSETSGSKPKAEVSKASSPGTRLVREWHGRTYTVDVLEKGFVCDGQRYRSLSEIARAITGARWSGPRFFGL
ncbi:MAG: hypothetical protein ACI8S3_001927 [Alphaproteobacteria bacterium]|jgi:hypothetical protein